MPGRTLFLNRGRRAVLNSPQSKRWRDCLAPPNLAKRLECVRSSGWKLSLNTPPSIWARVRQVGPLTCQLPTGGWAVLG